MVHSAKKQRAFLESLWRQHMLDPAPFSFPTTINGFRCIGACTWMRIHGKPEALPMLCWERPCRDCGQMIFTLCLQRDIGIRWFKIVRCASCKARPGSKKAKHENRTRWRQIRARLIEQTAPTPKRVARLCDAVAAYPGRLSPAPCSPDFVLKRLSLPGAPKTWTRVLAHCLKLGSLKMTKVGTYSNRNPKLGLTINIDRSSDS